MSEVGGMEAADFQSDWLLMQSYDSTNSWRQVEHDLGEVPMKVSPRFSIISFVEDCRERSFLIMKKKMENLAL